MAVNVGTGDLGATLPRPDQQDVPSALDGTAKRFGFAPPPVNKLLGRAFRRYAQRYLRKYISRLPIEACLRGSAECPVSLEDLEEWLATTSYEEWRKEQLREEYAKIGGVLDWTKMASLKSFVKDECYSDYKYPRLINARSDLAKVIFGPLVAKVTQVVMKHERRGYCPFIKYVPVADRPAYIIEQLRATLRRAYYSDYVSFEALFEKFQLTLEYDMIMHVIGDWPDMYITFYARFMLTIVCGTNVCRIMLHVYVTVEGVRMSGEMSTSLGNGWFNLMSQLFVFKKICHCKDVRPVVEGDDALVTHGSGDVGPTSDMYENLGLKVELGSTDTISEASFCGLVFDVDDQVNVTDVREALATFGWVSARYAKSKRSKLLALLRCKALSYLHQYPGCPVIQDMALYGLRMTAGVDLRWAMSSRHMSLWERDQLKDAVKAYGHGNPEKLPIREVPSQTRLLVEKLYGVSVEVQRAIERWFQTTKTLTHYAFDANYPLSWITYAQRYVIPSTDLESGWTERVKVRRPAVIAAALSPWIT